jgi:hypothetical protein
MGAMSDWTAAFAAAQATVECNGARHRLRWEAGELRALDHDDPEGERALAALGGAPCTCVEMLDGWARAADDLRVLLLGRRGYADPIQLFEPDPNAIPPGMRRSAHDREQDALLTLFGLGGGLPDRLVATVLAAWQARLVAGRARGLPAAGPQLEAALYGRLLATLRDWLGTRELTLELEMLPEGAEPRIGWREDGAVAAALPFGWLLDVWAPGMAVVAGRLSVAAERGERGGAWELATVGPDLGAVQTLALRLPERIESRP